MVCKILAGVNTTKTKEDIVFPRRRRRRRKAGCLSGHGRSWKQLFPRKNHQCSAAKKVEKNRVKVRLALDLMRLQEREGKERQMIKGDHQILFNRKDIYYKSSTHVMHGKTIVYEDLNNSLFLPL